jgi:hypothetical protein
MDGQEVVGRLNALLNDKPFSSETLTNAISSRGAPDLRTACAHVSCTTSSPVTLPVFAVSV